MALQLQLFSLQILHCKITFSAKVFTLDATLLTAVSYQSFFFIDKKMTYYFFKFCF